MNGLVQEGIKQDLGEALLQIKRPTFFFSDSPETVTETKVSFDFVLAQSIFSYSGLDLIKIGCPQFPAHWLKMRLWLPNFCLGEDESPLKSWIYPECVSYWSATLRRVAAGAGLRFEVLDWKHARQTWALFAAPKFDSDRFKNKPLTWNAGLENVLRQKKKENLAAAANAGSIRRNG